MKAKKLKEYLGTNRQVHLSDNKICVGSAYVSDLIHIDLSKMKVIYKMDTFNQGRTSLIGKSDLELLGIYDKLDLLVINGQIQDFLNGNDEIENPLPIFYHKYGEIIETFTEAYGYPNVTVDGILIYDNTFFKTKKECVIDAIKKMEHFVKSTNIQIKESEKKLAILKHRFYKEKYKVTQLRALKEKL